MPSELRQGFIDRSAERSSTKVYLPDVASDGTNWADLTADTTGRGDLLKAAFATLSKCNLTKQTLTVVLETDLPVIPTADDAQREWKLQVQYVDDVNGRFGEFSLPGPADLLVQANTDEVDIAANALMVAAIPVFEANMVSRDGNPITITRARIVRGAR